MIERENHRPGANVKAMPGHSDQPENLPYWVELWDEHSTDVERVLARAVNAPLARAIFKAAESEYEGRRITLRRGSRIILDRAER
ncbi:MAG TPA: hypothetical protein VFX37_01635 [Pseudolabrys sp.]|nr:hypothetical protein [Pseudolabrys sp.]